MGISERPRLNLTLSRDQQVRCHRIAAIIIIIELRMGESSGGKYISHRYPIYLLNLGLSTRYGLWLYGHGQGVAGDTRKMRFVNKIRPPFAFSTFPLSHFQIPPSLHPARS